MIPFLRLTDTTAPMAEELKEAAARVIDSGWFLNGPETKAFAKELSDSVGCAVPAVCVSNGLDALRLIFRALMETGRLITGDGVLVPANTYIASIMPLTEFGLRPILVEPATEDFCMDAAEAELRLKEADSQGIRVRAMLVVHLYGNPCWNGKLRQLAADNDLIVVEDNAQAIGAEAPCEGLNGTRKCGNLGHAAAFSFYPTKNIGALGDAGAVVTPDTGLADTVRALSNYGSDRRYHNIYQGYNCRMDEIQAAFLRVKLKHLREECERRRSIAGVYDTLIDNPLVIKPEVFTERYQVWHQYPAHVADAADRDRFRAYLEENGVGSDVHYATPPHRQPCYAGSALLSAPDSPLSALRVTESLADREVSLPIANVTQEEAAEIARIINSFE